MTNFFEEILVKREIEIDFGEIDKRLMNFNEELSQNFGKIVTKIRKNFKLIFEIPYSNFWENFEGTFRKGVKNVYKLVRKFQ